MFLALQLAASLLILIAFVLPQLGYASAKSLPLLAMNVVGAGILCAEALIESQWGFVVLEGVWGCVAAIGFVALLASRRRVPATAR